MSKSTAFPATSKRRSRPDPGKRGRLPVYTPEEDRLIAAAYEAGATVKQLAQDWHSGRRAIESAVQRAGTLFRPSHVDVTGQKFGRLRAVRRVESNGRGWAQWQCHCDCGAEVVVSGVRLRRQRTRSCGCLHRETFTHKRHGMTNSPEYNVWRKMRERCHNPNRPGKKRYRDRGIVVCLRWRKSFENFYADMGPRPSPKHTLERVDGNKGYEPGNCKWATRKEQARNTCANRMLTYQGQTRCIAEWAEVLGIKRHTLHGRLDSGWSVERTLGTPLIQACSRKPGETARP